MPCSSRSQNCASSSRSIVRVIQYFQEINADPVVYRWKYEMDDVFIV